MTRTIHVAGPKEASDRLNPDEVLCGAELPPGEVAVVFHPRAVTLTGGGFACPDCGESSRPAVSSGA
jgi:predicted RNA-binding Zn-ribbon protein involved in translation (DUF1610 family)